MAIQDPVFLIPIIGGTLLTFMGWGIYKASLKVVGFLIGAAIGVALGYTVMLLLIQVQPELKPAVIWVVGFMALLLGLINARLFLKIYYVVVFIAGAVYGASLKIVLLEHWPPSRGWFESLGQLGESPWAELILGLSLGLICVLLHRHVIILLTALLGSALIAITTELYWTFPVLAILGGMSQFGLLRAFRIYPKGRRREP